MNEDVNVDKISAEISDMILKLSIPAQNTVFMNVRNNIINARKEHIERELCDIKDHQDRTDYAAKTLETVIMSPFQSPAFEKKGY